MLMSDFDLGKNVTLSDAVHNNIKSFSIEDLSFLIICRNVLEPNCLLSVELELK